MPSSDELMKSLDFNLRSASWSLSRTVLRKTLRVRTLPMMYPMSISLSSFCRPFYQKRVYLVRRELLNDSCDRMNRQQAYIPITPKVLWVKSALSLPSTCCIASRIRFLPVLLSVSCWEYCYLSAVKVVPLLSTWVCCRLACISLSLSSSNHPSSLDALPFAY